MWSSKEKFVTTIPVGIWSAILNNFHDLSMDWNDKYNIAEPSVSYEKVREILNDYDILKLLYFIYQFGYTIHSFIHNKDWIQIL